MARIKSLNDSGFKNKHRKAVLKAMKRPIVKLRTKAAAKARWNVPGYRENIIKKLRKIAERKRFLKPSIRKLKDWEVRNCVCGKAVGKPWNYRCDVCAYDKRRRKGLLEQAKIRAVRKGIPFYLKLKDLKIPKICPVLSIPIFWGRRTNRDHSPSIDRIIPERGYKPKNIIIVSWKANNIKRNWSVEDLRKVAEFYEFLSTTK